MNDVVKTVRVIAAAERAETIGPHGQHLVPCVTKETCGAEGISAAMVNMAPGKVAKAHFHAHSETIVVCLRGRAATLIGPELTPHVHGPGEFLYVPEGVVHVAVNLSDTEDLVAVDIRTDPLFSDDLVLVPEYDAAAADIAVRLRRELAVK
ncbi:cupin domain-containing protein [Nocardia sp. NBC_01730]|uniref:cupin domain-containing protein n=1 Tax=Nocardia sp. NBC_01730 TaxID=2975998 RepID=UPI002E118B07|nr:cupin domain-containing protein [Nocardia sp. NBC_01730]